MIFFLVLTERDEARRFPLEGKKIHQDEHIHSPNYIYVWKLYGDSY